MRQCMFAGAVPKWITFKTAPGSRGASGTLNSDGKIHARFGAEYLSDGDEEERPWPH